MDLSYDRLLAQVRHEIAKFFLIHTSYFGHFGPNKADCLRGGACIVQY